MGQDDRQTAFQTDDYTLCCGLSPFFIGMAYGSKDKARCRLTWHDLIARFVLLGHIRQPSSERDSSNKKERGHGNL
jgi:hypothetical protein